MGEKQISSFDIRSMTSDERQALLRQLKHDRMVARTMNNQGMPPTTMPVSYTHLTLPTN